MQTTNPQGQSPDGDTPKPIQGHSYDGIQEYDNPMPGWWVWLFIGTAVFSLVYVLGIQYFDFVDTYEDDLAEGLQDLEAIRAQYAASMPAFEVDEATLSSYVGDPVKIEAGALHYAQCIACHGDQGQGLIGPNLTDQYWKLGGSNVDIFSVISQGALEKGMPPWEGVFSPEQRAELLAYIRSLEGTNPPNAKEQEGELYIGS